jgi:hypothetical protein
VKTTAQDARRMLVALLANPDDVPVDGVEHLKGDERLFLIATCAARLIEEAVCAQASYDPMRARRGLDNLIDDMRAHIIELCHEGALQ